MQVLLVSFCGSVVHSSVCYKFKCAWQRCKLVQQIYSAENSWLCTHYVVKATVVRIEDG